MIALKFLDLGVWIVFREVLFQHELNDDYDDLCRRKEHIKEKNFKGKRFDFDKEIRTVRVRFQ